MKINILFIHHKKCPVTLYHYEQFLKFHENDNDIKIVPITYPQHKNDCIENSYIANNLHYFRKNEKAVFHRIRKNNPYDLDCLIWDYVLFSGEKADKIIIMEWDVLCRQNIKEFYGELLNFPLIGNEVRLNLKEHKQKNWHWLKEKVTVSSEFINKYEQYITSLTPTCGIIIDWELAVKNALLVKENPNEFNNIHNELAIGTLSKINKVDPTDFKNVKKKMIDWHKNLIEVKEIGIFHPVKKLNNCLMKPKILLIRKLLHFYLV